MSCPSCLGLGWVCARHPDLAWGDPRGCDCGPGVPCDCNPTCSDDAIFAESRPVTDDDIFMLVTPPLRTFTEETAP